jgi:hypothetical protein
MAAGCVGAILDTTALRIEPGRVASSQKSG